MAKNGYTEHNRGSWYPNLANYVANYIACIELYGELGRVCLALTKQNLQQAA